MPTYPELLDFEARWPRHSGAKEEAIIRRFGINPPRFYQLLYRAVSSTEGLAHDPVTAHRVIRRHSGSHQIASSGDRLHPRLHHGNHGATLAAKEKAPSQ